MSDSDVGGSALDLPQNLQPPMANGEIVFDAPWQGRVFGMAVTLAEGGAFAWSDFQQSLIETIAQWEAQPRRAVAPEDPYPYFELFAEALERVLLNRGLVARSALDQTTQEIASRPHGHDH